MVSEFLSDALSLARTAYKNNEIPVGAVVVKDGKIIGRGYNRREATHDATSHAEIEAIRDACKTLGDWRLDGCEIYVTLEPCPMCAGAIINARIKTVVFGAYDNIWGAADSKVNLFSARFPNSPEVFGGIREEECKALLCDFFKNGR